MFVLSSQVERFFLDNISLLFNINIFLFLVHHPRASDGLLLRHDGSHNLEEQGSQQRRGI